jgi:hypothetical protein
VHRCDESSGAWASRLATSTISCKTRRGVHVTGWFHMCKHYDHTRVVGSFVGNRRHETHSSITLWLRCDKIINPQPGSKRAQNMQKSSQDLLFLPLEVYFTWFTRETCLGNWNKPTRATKFPPTVQLYAVRGELTESTLIQHNLLRKDAVTLLTWRSE